MDLGIAGKKAIVCASSRGLGKGCAFHLADAGCEVTINGRSEAVIHATAKEIAEATGARVNVVVADVSTHEGQKALLEACPDPDILVNNNGGPPRKDYRELSRDEILDGVVQNMVTPIEMIQKTAHGMAERGFGRIVNITSLSVLNPVEGLDLSSGARAGLTAFLGGVARQYAASNVTFNNILPGKMDTERLRSGMKYAAQKLGVAEDNIVEAQMAEIPAKRFGTADEFGALCAFICSQYGGYITGRNFLVDGGLNLSAF